MINPLRTSASGIAAYRLRLAAYRLAGIFIKKPSLDSSSCRARAAEAMTACLADGFEPHYCLLADMSLHSGVKRLAVWNYSAGNILFTALVSHGSGSDLTRGTDGTRCAPRFSDTEGSLLSSVGVYRIAERYEGKYGTSFRLDGISDTNRNARSRAIVLHAYDCIPDFEIYPHGTPESAGCPAVSRRTLHRLDALLQSPAALYIYSKDTPTQPHTDR